MFKKIFPIVIFILISSLIIRSLLYYSPSWGLMDDFQNLEGAKFVWSGGNFFGNLTQIVVGDFGWGMFRPVYYTWAVLVYKIFENTPLLIYIGIAIFNLVTLLLWGFILDRTWPSTNKNKYLNIFLYPLTYFIFTPFWNTFMYISSQQKFIIFFSALAIYFFYRGYARERKIYFIFSVLAILLSTLSHPEGIFLNLAMLLLSLVLFIITKRYNCFFNFILNLLLFIPYLFFTITVQLKGSYTSKYGDNISLSKLAINFLTAQALIKFLFLFAVIYFCFLLIVVIKNRNTFSPVFLIFPLSFLCFIIILTPWGYPNYHLSILTPFIMGMFFPIYSFLNLRSSTLKILVNSFLVITVLLVLFYICFPRISKMSDIGKTEQFIVDFEKQQRGNVYFIPQPSMEACYALMYFTKAKIIYLGDAVLSGDKLIESASSFIIFRDECPRVYLNGVQESKEIYKNNTWKILLVKKEPGIEKEFKVDFPENFMEKVKNILRR